MPTNENRAQAVRSGSAESSGEALRSDRAQIETHRSAPNLSGAGDELVTMRYPDPGSTSGWVSVKTHTSMWLSTESESKQPRSLSARGRDIFGPLRFHVAIFIGYVKSGAAPAWKQAEALPAWPPKPFAIARSLALRSSQKAFQTVPGRTDWFAGRGDQPLRGRAGQLQGLLLWYSFREGRSNAERPQAQRQWSAATGSYAPYGNV